MALNYTSISGRAFAKARVFLNMKLSKEDLVEFVNKTRKTYLREANPYEVVPGTGREGVSGIVSPLQSMADEEDLLDVDDLPEVEFELPDDEDIEIRNVVDQPKTLDDDKYKLYSAGAGNPFLGTVQETTKLTDNYIKHLVKEAYVHLEEDEFGLEQAQDAIRSDEDGDERAASRIRRSINGAKANEEEVVSALKDMIALYKSLSWRKQRPDTRVYYKIMEVYKLLKKGSHGGVM